MPLIFTCTPHPFLARLFYFLSASALSAHMFCTILVAFMCLCIPCVPLIRVHPVHMDSLSVCLSVLVAACPMCLLDRVLHVLSSLCVTLSMILLRGTLSACRSSCHLFTGYTYWSLCWLPPSPGCPQESKEGKTDNEGRAVNSPQILARNWTRNVGRMVAVANSSVFDVM